MNDIRRVLIRHKAPLFGVLLFLMLFGYAVYANYFDTLVKEETIHILPLTIETDGWTNTETLYVQDLSESSLYQDFTTINSAYLLTSDAAASGSGNAPPDSVSPNRSGTSQSDAGSSDTPASNQTLDEASVPSATSTSDGAIPSPDTVVPGEGESSAADTQQNNAEETSSQTPPTEDGIDQSVDTAPPTTEEEVTPPPDPEPDPPPQEPDPSPTAPEADAGGETTVSGVVSSFITRVRGRMSLALLSEVTPTVDETTTSSEPAPTPPAPEPSPSEPTVETPAQGVDEDVAPSEPLAEEPLPEDSTDGEVLPPVTTSDSATPDIIEQAFATTTVSDSVGSTSPGVAPNSRGPSTAPSSDTTVVGSSSTPTTSLTDQGPSGQQIVWNGFSLPYLAETETIENAQIRMSFGAKSSPGAGGSGVSPKLVVDYSFGDDLWVSAGDVVIEDEASNAINGGYFLFALPPIIDPNDLRSLKIRARYVGDLDEIEGIYIDSLWVEINAMTLDRAALQSRVSPDALTDLEKPKLHDLLSTEIDFTRDQLPHFALKYHEQRNIVVRTARKVFSNKTAYIEDVEIIHRDIGGLPIKPTVNETNDGLWSIQIPEKERKKLRPGEYTVELTINEGGVEFTDTFNFQWGLLAINTDETEYVKGELSTISLAALSPNGNTLCDATLGLYLINPENFIRRLPVTTSGLCNGNNVVDVPDYASSYATMATGTYELYVERIDPDTGRALAHTFTTFEVVEDAPFSIVRNGPTRIYPVEPYTMSLTVTASTSLTGSLTERVPFDYEIIDSEAAVRDLGTHKELSWNLDLRAGEQATLTYRFDSPDISPYLYELGPASISYEQLSASALTTSSSSSTPAFTSDTAEFIEHKPWQVASDATGNMIIYYSDTSTVPAGWTCLSCGSGTFYQKFVMGSSSYGVASGTATHNHTASAVVSASSDASSEQRTGTEVADVAHAHTLTPTVTATSSLPAYRELRVIQYNSAGEPASIPSGAVIAFGSTPPAGWTEISSLNGRYVYGENGATTTAGSNTHYHTVSSTTGTATGGTQDGRNGGTQVSPLPAAAGHTHTISTSTLFVNNEPPYIEVIYASTTGATSTPVGAITMWTDTPPAGWVNRSATPTDPFYNKFPKGSSSYGSTGGSETHTESDILDITSSGPIQQSTFARTSATLAGSSGTHAHQVDVTNFSTDYNIPPYVTVIFAQNYGLVPLYDQSAFRWYANTSTSTTPTDPWPAGATDLIENEPITSTSTVVGYDDKIRLRIGVAVTNATSTTDVLKLQYASTTSGGNCSALTNWADVGSATSSAVWKAYDNASLSDGATLSSSTLSGTDKLETYEESNPTASTPADINPGEDGEWDFSLHQNGAEAGVDYCFRMVKSDSTEFATYTRYPRLTTNSAVSSYTLVTPFDNEKVATNTPYFEFYSADPESEQVVYQIQVDNDYSFGSTVIDKESDLVAPSYFTDLASTDKYQFDSGTTIRFYDPATSLSTSTYYWRIRSRDTGSNTWGSWSTIRSFTIDTTVTASTWYQTTEEQFDTDALEGVETPGSDQVSLISGSTTGTTTSSRINFSWGDSGNAWGSLSWNDATTTGTIVYRVQYEVTDDTWADIPDSVLSGNSTGFTTTPVSLLGVDPDTYSSIRIQAVFTFGTGSPTLQDWTLAWGYRIPPPTVASLFPNEKTSTTTPTFEFTTDDPQGDDLVYQIEWSSDYNFGTSTVRTSDTDLGFVNITDGFNFSPFTSGDSIQFTVQSGDAFNNGTTYWWRVRAKDPPPGSDSYSDYSGPYSFTVDTSVTVSTWFQTTTEQFATDILSGATSTGGAATVATTAVETLVAYAEGNIQTPQYRTWNGSSWSSERSALTVGATINWVVVKPGETREEYVMATIGTDQDVNVQVYKNGAWGNLQELTTALPNAAYRGVDVAYENVSGDALVVTCDSDTTPEYWIWNGTSWTDGGSITLSTSNTCGWIKLVSDPTSDEIIMVSLDSSGSQYEAQVWDGSTWVSGSSNVFGSMDEVGHEGIAMAYEESGDQAVVAVSDGTGKRFRWSAWNGSVWSTSATVNLGDHFESGVIASDVGSDNMVLCYIDNDGDIGAVRWTTASWTGQIELETAWVPTDNADDDRPVDCAFEVGGSRDGYIMVTYSDLTNVRYRYWEGATWVAEADVSTIQDSRRVQLRRTGDDLLQLLAFDNTNDRYDYSYWNGSAWSTFQTLETDGSVGAVPFKEPFMIGIRQPGISGTVAGDPGLDWDYGSGPYWKEMTWNATSTGSSTILFQVEYYDGDSWELVPNAVIPGNSSGTTSKPIDLTGLLPVASTYNIIRPVANMACNTGICPELYDWTLTWSAGITVSGTAQQYDQSTNLTSGTVAVALNGVLQTGKTGTISGGAWSIANVNAAPGDIITVFIDGAADSGEAVGVTKYDGVGDVSGINLYERHLSIGSNDNGTVTNADIGLYDQSNDEDLFDDVSSGTLTLCASGETACQDGEIIIKSGNTYQPGSSANVVTHDIEINGTFKPNGNTIRVSGSWDNNATATMATSTVIFTASTTVVETIDQTGAVSGSFYKATFGETAGTATWSLVTAFDVDNNLRVDYGTLARGSVDITIGGNLVTGAAGYWTGVGTTTFDGATAATWSDANAAKQDIGYVVVDGAVKTLTLASNALARTITIGADDILDAGTPTPYDLTVLSHWTNNNVFTSRAGEVIFTATTTGRSIKRGSSSFYDLTFNGAAGAWSFFETTLSVTNDFTISTGTVTLPTGTTTIAGSFINSGGAFGHSNGEMRFTSTGAETITFGATQFTNGPYDLVFNGSGGTWNITDTSATTSHTVRILAGTPTLPSTLLSVGGSFVTTSGAFQHNSGTVQFYSSGSETVSVNSSSFNNLRFTGTGTYTLSNTNLTVLGDITIDSGTVVFPTGTLTLGGSLTNAGSITHSSGTVLFNATASGKTVTLGGSPLYNATFQSTTGGWTLASNATTTHNLTLTSGTLTFGARMSVGSTFTNSLQNASTTWTGSTLALYGAGTYQINASTTNGDTYDTLEIASSTKISMWNSSASTYTVDPTAYLYSKDHAGVDGDLYIFGAYARTSGTEYWSAATDFDGTTLVSPRQVDVRFENGASATLTNATLSVVGTSSGTTTISSISGTYTVNMSGGTTSMQYYSFDALGTTGVTLGTSTYVSSLQHGRFVPGVNAGTGLTVASSTIDANPAKQIFWVEFSTTSAITASNVTQTGGTPTSYWWFRESTGNLDGEAYDSDSGDPGSIRWDDSSYLITATGTVYSDAGITPMGGPTCDNVATSVRAVVNGGAFYDAACDPADGTYTINNIAFNGDPVITVFLNTNGGEKAVTVTKTPTGDIGGLDLYANRVMTRHEGATALSIADMALYDEDIDTDIAFNAATGTPDTLTVRGENELFIFASTTFTPNGNVTLEPGGSGNSFDATFHIDNNATATAQGTETYSIGGRFQVDSGGAFVPASSTVIMTATSTGKTISSPGTINLNDLTFSGTGSWDLVANLAIAGDIDLQSGTFGGSGNIDLSYGSFGGDGTLLLTGGTVTLERTNTLGSSTPWTFYNLTLGNGTVAGTTTPGGTATTTISRVLTVSAAHVLNASSGHFDLRGSGSPFVVSGTFTEGTSIVRYSNGTSATVLSDTYYNLDLNAASGTPTYTTGATGINVLGTLAVGGDSNTTVTFDASDPVVSVTGDVVIRGNGTLTGSASASFSVLGNWDNNGTYNGSGGTVTMTGSGSPTIAAGASSFSNLVLNGTGSFSFTENATATAAFTLTQVGALTTSPGVTISVGGTFTNAVSGALTDWSNSTLYLYSGTSYSLNSKAYNDTYGTLTIGPNTDVRMWNSSAATTNVDASGSLYSMDHGNSDGALYIYGSYPKSSGTDYWSYAYDFDGGALGGSSRAVTVNFASGASAYYTGGGLFVVGQAGATTTITNQGSGTYSVMVGGTASTTMRYYSYRNLDVSGVVYTGTPNVVNLGNGDIEVSIAGGSGMTVGGTAITQSPARTFSNNRFATTTAIAAYNVTATGTTVSSWRFASAIGNLSGEAKDNDPGGDPGYIVWDDSLGSITISGHVYQDEGTIVSSVCDDGLTQNVKLVIAGNATTTSCASSNGLYSFNGVSYSTSDNIIVYIDGEAPNAATVSQDPVSSIADMELYENRVIVRHEGTNPLTIADMAVYDSSDDPGDVPFTAVDAGSDTLSLPADYKLLVWTGKEFAPNGDVTLSGGGAGQAYDGTLELQTNALFTAAGSESHSIGGSMILGTGATFSAAQSTITFTTTGLLRTVNTNEDPFYNVVFNGSGSWTMPDQTATAQNNFTITAGDVTLPLGTTTVAGSFNTTGGSFTQATGTLALNGTAGGKTLRLNGSSLNRLVVDGVGGSWSMPDTNATTTLSVTVSHGTLSLPSGIFAVGSSFIATSTGTLTHNSGTLRLTGTTTESLKANGSDLGSVIFAGSGAYTMLDGSLALAGSLTIQSGAVTFATNTLAIAGSLTATGGTFDHASGTVLFNSSDTGETVDPGASPFYNVSFANASGGWTVSSATTTHNLSLTTLTSYRQASSTTLSVGGVFLNSVGGSATNWDGSTLRLVGTTTYAINTKSAGGDRYNVLYVGPDLDVTSWNTNATSTTVDPSGSLYSMDHGAADGELYIYGDYHRTTGVDYWSYATDFDGAAASRPVTVRFADTATSTLSQGTLNIIGAAGATTTITNQGSGTYSVQASGGTFNASYYAFRNLGISGLELSGTTTVSSLSYGDFELAVDTGTLITLSSTTLNANASAVYTAMTFSTTTAISGKNITLVGTTPSAWTFTAHSGNLAGENYDVDGGDNCGSLRWTDSSCLLLAQTHFRWRNDDGGEGVPNSEWYDLSWTRRVRVVLTNDDPQSYTNAVVKVTIPYDSDMQGDFSDLRFTADDGTTALNFFKESYTASSEAVVWVEVPLLATSTDTSIFAYYKNAGASDGSASTTFPYLDEFEDSNISEYSGDTSLFSVDASFAYERTRGLKASDVSGQTTDGIYRTDVSVAQGETIRYFEYVDAGGTFDEVCTLFGVQTPGSNNNNYAVCLEQVAGTDRMSIAKDVVSNDNDGSGTVLSSTTVSYSTGWYEVEIRWGTDDSITATLYSGGSEVASTTVVDSTYTSGGVGFSFWFQHGGWDIYSARPLLTTEPSVRLGVEQVSGGATWIAALDTLSSSLIPSSTARLRFVIENSGLDVTGKQFRLEYAEKGASPSCEAVSYATYSAVPDSTSCGTDAFCMTDSSNFADQASTTDLLGGLGTFTYGKMVQDTSNMTGSLNINQDEFTEVEYDMIATQDATAGGYCFRVTDNGADLDSYSEVAEMQIRYDPYITNVTLNDGFDISLSPGATTTVSATGTVTDLNGYSDVVSATGTIYRSSVSGGASCTANDNECYPVSSCSFSNCSGNSCIVTCSADIYYFADATDIGVYSGDSWYAYISSVDTAGGYGTATVASGTELLTLRALEVTQSIDYGSLETESDTGSYNATTTIDNIGNDAIDILLAGTNLTNGASVIPVNEQKYATSSFTYSSCTTCNLLGTSTMALEVDLAKPTNPTPVTDVVFWGIYIPFGTAADAHEGVNTFYATAD